MARARRERASLDVVITALTSPKHLDVSASALMAEAAASPRGYGAGGRVPGTRWRWRIDVNRLAGRLKARFLVGEDVVLGLDYHDRESRDRRGGICPPGFHWDVWWPLWTQPSLLFPDDPYKTKFAAAARYSADISEAALDRAALAALSVFCHIRLAPETQAPLPALSARGRDHRR